MSIGLEIAFWSFKWNYSELLNDITLFFQTLPKKLKKKFSQVLENLELEIIYTSMFPNDPNFNYDETKGILHKWHNIKEAMKLVLSKFVKYVEDVSWFYSQEEKLNWWIDRVTYSEENFLQKYLPKDDTKASMGGIGGFNPGVDSEILQEIKISNSFNNLIARLKNL